ncbi:MAG: Gmad2 immunoglobulin-like domain-containing protein [Actinomycetota bacterium]
MKTRLLGLLMLLAACAPAGEVTTTGGAAPITTLPPSTSSPTTVSTTTSVPGGCGPGLPLVADGLVMEQVPASADAQQIGAITWQTDQSCERFTIELVTAEGAPATSAPAVEAEFLRAVGILRVTVAVEATVVTDQLVESGLVDRLFVARRADRSLFVDFHLSGVARARITVGASPGTVLIELEPGGSEYPATAAIADNVVVITPTAGPVRAPLLVNGYSRNFEANNIARITQDGNVLAEEFTTGADWAETWGEFSLTINPTGSGTADLFVGEQSAQDGSDRGVVIPIELP